MMIRALLRKQLRELGAAFLRSSKTGKARSRASAVGYALLFAVLVVVLMLCFAGMALPLASVLLSAEMGLALGLVLPNLHWTSEAAVIKMSGCTLLSMAANLVAVLVLTLAQTNLLEILPLPAVMAAALVLLAGADGLLGHWLKTRGARRLAELS